MEWGYYTWNYARNEWTEAFLKFKNVKDYEKYVSAYGEDN